MILRWHLQDGHIAIPGSHNEKHIQENFDIFDFELTPDEMEQIASLDKNERLGDWWRRHYETIFDIYSIEYYGIGTHSLRK